jgi:hypothetical protein
VIGRTEDACGTSTTRAMTATPGSLSLGACTARVIGNRIGSGFFIAPAALAAQGTTAPSGRAVMALGAGLVGDLAVLLPALHGQRAIAIALALGSMWAVAFPFSIGTVHGAGAESGMGCLILLLAATPIRILLDAHEPRANA